MAPQVREGRGAAGGRRAVRRPRAPEQPLPRAALRGHGGGDGGTRQDIRLCLLSMKFFN